MKGKSIVLITILLIGLLPSISAEDDPPAPPPLPSGQGQITDYGSLPTWTYINTSVTLFLNFSDPDNNTVTWARVYANGGNLQRDMLENDTNDNDTSDGKQFFYTTDFDLPRGDHEYVFAVKSNGSIYQSDWRTLSIVNREPYFLEKPPPKMYVGNVYCYEARAHDPDGDDLTYDFTHNFTAGDWANKTWDKKNYTFCGIPARAFTRWINISIYDGYDLIWLNSTIRCYEDEGERGDDPPFRSWGENPFYPSGYPSPDLGYVRV